MRQGLKFWSWVKSCLVGYRNLLCMIHVVFYLNEWLLYIHIICWKLFMLYTRTIWPYTQYWIMRRYQPTSCTMSSHRYHKAYSRNLIIWLHNTHTHVTTCVVQQPWKFLLLARRASWCIFNTNHLINSAK